MKHRRSHGRDSPIKSHGSLTSTGTKRGTPILNPMVHLWHLPGVPHDASLRPLL